MEYFILGSTGRLGSEIYRTYFSRGIISIPRKVYRTWTDPHNVNAIKEYFKKLINKNNAVLFIASGLLDPSKTQLELNRVNYLLPKNIIEATQGLNIRIITFGTIMEKYRVTNSYIDSKKKFLDYIDKLNYPAKRLTHIRLHTLYGIGKPSEFMFLGGIYHALKNNLPFPMTSGEQLREYHHILDEVNAIDFLVQEENDAKVINLSHGDPVRLCDLAMNIFHCFQKEHLLKVGEFENLENEVFKIERNREALLLPNIQFRDSFSAINIYLKSY